MKNIFTNISDELISKIHKVLTILNTPPKKKPQTAQLKNGQRTWIGTSLKMANRHMKRCSTSLSIREMQIKTITIYCFTPLRMAIINKSTNNKHWWRCGERGMLLYCWWESRLVQPLWKAVWAYCKKLKMELHYDPVIPLLGIHPKKPKTLI